MKKLVLPRWITAIVIVLILFGATVPALAQEANPPPDATSTAAPLVDWQAVWDWVKLIGTFIAVLVVIAYGTGVSTEALKDLLRYLTANRVLKLFFPDGSKSALLAFLVAYASAKGFNTVMFKDIPLVASLNPELVKSIAAIMIWAAASFLKKQGALDYVYTATTTAAFNLPGIPALFNLKKPK